jgi:dihydroorotase-like cyclic amidohydrolase
MDTMLPVLISEGHHKRGFPLRRIAELTAENPARIMGLSHAKGMLVVGMDADIALVDLNREWKAANADAVSSAGYTIYDGWTFRGVITHTFVRGRTVVKDGALVDDAVGSGRYVRRSLSA